MAEGFARDVTTEIAIPQVQAPNFNQNRSTVEDVADIASFGLGIFEQQKAKKQEAARQGRLNAVSGGALKAQSMLEDIKIQKGTITSSDILRVSRKVGGQFTSPSERTLFNSTLGEGLSGPLFQSIVGDDLDEAATTKASFRQLSKGAQVSALTSLEYDDINEVPDEALGELEAIGLVFDANVNKMKAAKEKFAGSPTTETFNEYLSTNMDTSIDLMAQNLQVTINDLDKLGLNSPEYKERLGQMKSGFTNVLEGRLNEARIVLLQAKKNATVEEAKRLTADFELAESTIKGTISRVTTLSDDAWKSSMDLANNLKNEMSIDASESFPQVMMLQEVFKGGGFDEIMKMVLVESRGKDLIAAKVSKDLERGLLNSGRDINIGSVATIASKKSIQELRGIFEGRAINEAKLEDRKTVIEDRWKWVNTMIKDPELINSLSKNEEKMDKLGFAMIDILKTAETDGTNEDLVRANELLSSKAFGNYLSKIRPEEAEVVSRYVASSTALSLDKEFSKNTRMIYNADTGSIVKPTITRQGKAKASQDFGKAAGGSIDTSSFQATEVIKGDTKLQSKLDNAVDSLVKYSPFINSLPQGERVKAARDYLLNTIPDSQVKGTRQDFSKDKSDAIKNGQSMEELEKRFSAETRFTGIETDLSALQKKELERKTGVQGTPTIEDTSDMDDETFETYIEELKKARVAK